MTKSCPKGQYYCYTDNKCKKIPKGYAVGARGYLKQEPQEDDSKNNGNGNGNGNSKSNGSSGNGGGNGNGGNGGNGGSGGVSEATDLGTLEGVKYYDGSDRNPNTGLPKGLKGGNGKSTDKPLKGVPYNILRAHYEIPVQEVKVTGMDEVINYKTFAQQAQDAREKKAKRREEGKKKDDEFMAKKKERVAKGVKFYDSKGKGYVKSGVKTYESVMLTYKSGQGVDAKIGGKSVRNTINNVKTGVNAIKNIKKDGLVAGVKNTINKNKNTTTKQSVSSNVGDAISNYQLNMYLSQLKNSLKLCQKLPHNMMI